MMDRQTFLSAFRRMADFLKSGRSGPLSPEETTSIQRIADALAGAGLHVVRLQDLEDAAVRNALHHSDGNRTQAARLLGISVRTLQRKLKTNGNGLNGETRPDSGL